MRKQRSNKRCNEQCEGASCEEEQSKLICIPPDENNINSRLIGLYGPIDEDRCREMIAGLYYLKESGKETIVDEEKKAIINHYSPIKFLISTEGGVVADAFAVYDVMRDVQKDCEIHTFGVGVVMSAGVLLLAAGTKGQRRIGKNCRLMIHQITSGNYGHLEDLEASFNEARWCQEQYIEELCKLTKLTKNKMLSIFKKKVDFYFDSVTALKFGIVDEIV